METSTRQFVIPNLMSRLLRNRIYVAGMECTGSTYVYQVSGALGATPIKVHHRVRWRPLLKFVTYRDPRDVICSYARRQYAELTETQGLEAGLLSSHRRLFQEAKRHEDLRRYSHDRSALLIRYESYFGGNEAELVDLLAYQLGLHLPPEHKARILHEFSVESNQERMQHLAHFSEVDAETQIHGHHISSGGRSGVWRTLFTPAVKARVKEDIGDFIIEYGYEPDYNW